MMKEGDNMTICESSEDSDNPTMIKNLYVYSVLSPIFKD